MLSYLQLFGDQAEELAMLDDAARGRFVMGLLLYATQGVEPAFSGEERLLWPSFRRSIDAAAAKVEAQSANGSKGGRPRKDETQVEPNENPTKPNETQHKPSESQDNHIQVQVQEQVQVHVSSPSNEGEGAKAPSARTRGKFSPPTADEVKAYASDKGLTLDADRFVDFYAAKGWKVGNTPMKDWRAAARNWARDDHRREPAAFRPPKNGEVMSYAAEHGWRGFDYNAFVEHYAARGWCINGTQITDWHPLAQSWWRKNNMEDLPY